MEAVSKNSMFSKEAPKAERDPTQKRRELPLLIDDAVAWSRTKRGGKDVESDSSVNGV